MSSKNIFKLNLLLPGKYQENPLFKDKTIEQILEENHPTAIIELIRFRDSLIAHKVRCGRTTDQAANSFHKDVHMCLDLYVYTNYDALKKYFVRFSKDRLKLELHEYNAKKKQEEREKKMALEIERRLAQEKELQEQLRIQERQKFYGDVLGSW
ncbi:hypothetical protein AYA92_RS17390 [Acinetobacter baumannii]|nr:hypothetical protein [Acinetobacter baumannii]